MVMVSKGDIWANLFELLADKYSQILLGNDIFIANPFIGSFSYAVGNLFAPPLWQTQAFGVAQNTLSDTIT